MHTALIPIALAIGALLAVQAAANVQLAASTGSPLGASAIQLALGSLVLVALAVVVGSAAAAGRVGDAEPWHLVGGLGSAVYITAGILVLPRLGAVAAVGLFIAGQMLASLAVDGLGLLEVERQELSAGHVLGGIAVLAGAAALVRAGRSGSDGSRRAPWQALALGAGVALALQGPVNAALRRDLDAPVAVGALSFLVATAAMLALLALAHARGGAALPHAPVRLPWWGWAGGLVGATYVTAVPLMLPELGTAVTIGLTVAGQQLAALAVDRHGLLLDAPPSADPRPPNRRRPAARRRGADRGGLS